MGIADPRNDIVGGSCVPMPIADMAPWSFWSRPAALGLPDRDVQALIDGTANDDQITRAQERSNAAMRFLIEAPVNESTRRPS